MDNSKLKEKLEKVSKLTGQNESSRSTRALAPKEVSQMTSMYNVESTKGQFLKAIGKYKVSAEERKINRQEKYFEKISGDFKNLSNDLSQLENKFIEKNNLVEIKKSEIDRLKQNLNDYKNRLEETKRKIQLKDRALQESTLYTEKVQEEINEVKNQLLRVEEEYGHKNKGYSWQDSLLKELEEERDILADKYDNKKNSLDRIEEKQKKNNNTVNALKVEIQNIKDAINRTTDQLYESKTSIKEKEITYHEIVKKVNVLKRHLSGKSLELKKVQGKVERLTRLNESLETRNIKFENAKKQIDQLLFEKRNQIGSLEAENHRLEAKVKRIITKTNECKVELAEKDNYTSKLKDEIEILREKGDAQERELKISRDEFLEVKREYERKNKIHEELTAQKENGMEELRRLEREISTKKLLTQEFIEKNRQSVDVIEDIRSNTKKVKLNLDDIRQQHKIVKNKNDDLSGILARLKTEEESRNGQLKELEREIGFINKTINKNQEEIHQREEDELFFTKKIEALESLLIEKRKREAYSKEKRSEQTKLTELMQKRFLEVEHKYKMLKTREDNEKTSFERELQETEKIKIEIGRVEAEMAQTFKMINQLREKRIEVAKEAEKQSRLLSKKKLEFHSVVSEGFNTDRYEYSDDAEEAVPPFIPRPRLDV